MTGPARALDSVRVAVTDSIDLADAPNARNAGERLVFDMLFPPAARPGCPADPATRYDADTSAPGAIYLRPPPGHGPTVIIRTIGDRAALDMIDSENDVMVTDRPVVIHYAKTRADLDMVPLPWDRVYLLLAGEPPAHTGDVLGAVRAEARSAAVPEWWRDRRACDLQPSPMARTRSGRVVYASDDSVARALAERLLALGGVTASVVASLSRSAFQRALASRDEAAYVVAVPARTTSPCAELRRLGIGPPPSDGDSVAVVPLVETRSTLIVRRGTVEVWLDSLGTPHLEPAP